VKASLKWLRWRGILLLAALTPTCRQIVQRASLDRERPLMPWTRIRLQVHLRICRGCERYLRQMDFLRAAAAASAGRSRVSGRGQLASEAKNRIKRRLRCERVG